MKLSSLLRRRKILKWESIGFEKLKVILPKMPQLGVNPGYAGGLIPFNIRFVLSFLQISISQNYLLESWVLSRYDAMHTMISSPHRKVHLLCKL